MPRILAKTTEITHEEWVKLRRTGIGGSDAATVCGLNPYSSLIELWADKTGRLPDKETSEAMRQGQDLEEYVARRFCEATGKKIRRRKAIFQHDKYDSIIADIDREIVGENAGLECKTTSTYNKSDFENGEIPLNYLCQCRHYMNVMGYDKMYLAVLVLGKAFHCYTITYDKDENEALLRMELDFWEQHIIPDVRPDPDGSDSAERVLETLYSKQQDDEIALFSEEETAKKLMEIKDKIKLLEADEAQLKQKLIFALDGNARGVTKGWKFSWKPQSRTTVDSKKLKQLYPKIYDEVTKTTTSQVFRISTLKERE